MLGRTILNVTVNTRIIVSNSQVREKKRKKNRQEKEGRKKTKQTQIIVKDDGTWRKQP